MARRLEVEFIGDTADLERSLGRVGSATDNTGGKFEKFKKVAGGAGLAIAGGLGALAASTVKDLAEVEKINAQTAAVIKSTGGAAGVTAAEVEGLAGKLELMSGVEAESIQTGQNMLLTFTNLKNGVGKGNDIFDQATKTMLDMSVALGSDAKGSAVQRGKALNDPIKGVGALSKIGVAFTEEQKEQIKTLVNSGKTMEAQKIILAELNKEFGGSAKAAGGTLSGQLKILQAHFGNMAEGIVSALIPALKDVTAVAMKFGSFLAENPKLAKALVFALGGLAAVLLTISAASHIAAAATAVWAAGTKVAAAAQWLWNAAMSANPIGLVVAALAALVAGVILAYKHSETFRNIVQDAWAAIKSAAEATWAVIKGVFEGIVAYYSTVFEVGSKLISGLVSGIKSAASAITGAATWVKDKIVDGIEVYLNAYKSVGGWIINRLKDGVLGVANFASDVGGWIKNRVVDGIQATAGAIGSVGGWIVNRVEDGIKGAASFAGDIGGWIKNRVKEGVEATADAVRGVGGWLIERVANGIKAFGFAGEIGGWLMEKLSSIIDTGGDLGKKVFEAAKSLGSGIGNAVANAFTAALKSMVRGAVSILNGIINTINSVIDGFNKIPGPNIGKIGQISLPRGYAAGGTVPRTGWAMVGEEGPELVRLPGGAHVYPHGTGPINEGPAPVVHVHFDDPTLRNLVRVEIEQDGRRQSAQLAAGVLA